ncbi:MAG: glycosyltransferase family 39 protein [Candidatus Omnitrophica bacterium]|nr:glycosyltransferase family 39 protein [Candidatus Omnitrophota bacterium]
MKTQYKQYILENTNKKSMKEISKDLGLKERKVRKFLEKHRGKEEKKSFFTRIKELFPLLSILALSLSLNIIGNTWGIPANWHPDNKVHHIASFFKTGDLNPHFLTNPSLNLYLQYFFVKFMMLFKGQSLVNSPALITHCRTVIAIVGCITVFIVFLISRQLFNKRSGLLSALLCACAAGNVFYSHFSTPEALVTLLSMTSLFFMIKFLDSRKNIFIYLAACFFGLAFSTKFTIFPLFAFLVLSLYLVQKKQHANLKTDAGLMPRRNNPIIVQGLSLLVGIIIIAFTLIVINDNSSTHVLTYLNGASFKSEWNAINAEYIPFFVSKIKNLLLLMGFMLAVVFPIIQQMKTVATPINNLLFSKELSLSVLLVIIVFLIGTPFSILDHKQLFHDLFVSWQAQYYYAGFQLSGMKFYPYLQHVINLTGWPLFIAGMSGMVWSIISPSIKNKSRLYILIGYFILIYVFLSTRSNTSQRFIFPIIPIISVFAGIFFELGKEIKWPKVKMLVMPAVVFITGYSLFYAINVDLLLLKDSRVEANRWIERNIPGNAVVAAFSYQRYLPNFDKNRKIRFLNQVVNRDSDIKQFIETFPTIPVDYLILSDLFYKRYMHYENYPVRKKFFRSLLNEEMQYTIAAEFKYKSLLTPEVDFVNPKITILKNKRSNL